MYLFKFIELIDILLVRFGKAHGLNDLDERTIKKIAVCAGSGILTFIYVFLF